MMRWEQQANATVSTVPDDIADLAFAIVCRCLPLDHAHALSQQLLEALPWLEDEDRAGIHLIHGAESGNGWMRPDDTVNNILHLSRRTRMTLRVPKTRIEATSQLTGKTLDIAGYSLTIGSPAVKRLSTSSTLFARYIITHPGDQEEQFHQQAVEQLEAMDIRVRKILSGRSHVFSMPGDDIVTRSLLLADLTADESITLQQRGLGPGRKIGCGLFIPHKGIDPVKPVGGE